MRIYDPKQFRNSSPFYVTDAISVAEQVNSCTQTKRVAFYYKLIFHLSFHIIRRRRKFYDIRCSFARNFIAEYFETKCDTGENGMRDGRSFGNFCLLNCQLPTLYKLLFE